MSLSPLIITGTEGSFTAILFTIGDMSSRDTKFSFMYIFSSFVIVMFMLVLGWESDVRDFGKFTFIDVVFIMLDVSMKNIVIRNITSTKGVGSIPTFS